MIASSATNGWGFKPHPFVASDNPQSTKSLIENVSSKKQQINNVQSTTFDLLTH